MRVFYDGFIFDFQQYGGINRYFNEIIARLPLECIPVVSTYLGQRDFWPVHPRRRIIRSRPFAKIPALAGLGRAWMSLRTSMTSFDIAHPTYFQRLTPGDLSRLGRPLVVTVHDMIHEIFREKSDPLNVAEAKRTYIERADAILCDSAQTRVDLLDRFPHVEDRAFVTPLASSMVVDPIQNQAASDLDRPYFLYVGGREGYKNFGVLLRALQRFSPRNPEFQLRVVGDPWRPEERRLMEELGVESFIVHEGKVGDSRLSVLYHRSVALVYPSLYEGFGIPLLEAMRCRTAVISSQSSSLPEVGGAAPLYFEPSNADALCAHMESLVRSSSLRAECVARGIAQERQFSWDHTADLTFAVYEKLASSAGISAKKKSRE
jgi:glycosyltransferase involved in cell wall biosynthesis